ncbi:class I SAM-dependent methyltransferase [Streptomyces sp. N2-109]|uniref:Class I SAM-dependent methyltransferase n=1 Tax=Streptomyces gossypii TaxID=2883101 RepID=A0ABT2JKV9_9ACTN|nr:class I SAM-dependent methyltransferase [Streptomyces gossypii]MCT2588525.1 class I SAM-dependent methyltransferase [Streptomyces gossypii]
MTDASLSETLREKEHAGTGPGEITPDGCAVRMWARLATNGEPEIIEAAVPSGATILELGAGAGRMTRPLREKGFRVTAVDESAAMLAQIQDTPTVCSAIEGLRLAARFDVVTLTSFLVNTADPALRAELLRTCAHHVADGGCVLVQCEGAWHTEVEPGTEWERDGMTIRLASRERLEDGARRTRMEYVFEDAAWSQTFLSHRLSQQEVEEALAEAGLAVDRWLTEDRTWVRAVPG